MKALIDHIHGMQAYEVGNIDIADVARIDKAFRRNDNFLTIQDLNGDERHLEKYVNFDIHNDNNETVVTFRFDEGVR